MQLTEIILEVLILLCGLYLALFKSYFTEKGKNLATLEDIEDITKKVEEVKSEIQKQQLVEKQKRDLKYNALLNSLTLIDAHYSQLLAPGPGQKIKRQHATTEEARRCHNDLILTSENIELIEMFSLIMFGNNDKVKEPPTTLLNKFRNMIRKDLGFGNEIPLNEETAWFGYFTGEKE
jgi:hypothetical protein